VADRQFNCYCADTDVKGINQPIMTVSKRSLITVLIVLSVNILTKAASSTNRMSVNLFITVEKNVKVMYIVVKQCYDSSIVFWPVMLAAK